MKSIFYGNEIYPQYVYFPNYIMLVLILIFKTSKRSVQRQIHGMSGIN